MTRDSVTADAWKKYDISQSSSDGSTYTLKIIDEDTTSADPEAQSSSLGSEKSTLVISIGGAVSTSQGITRAFDGSIKEFKWYV